MKRGISLLLAGIILLLEPNLEQKPSQAQAGAGVVVLMTVICLAAAGFVIYVYKTNTAQKMRWLVLNDDDLAGHLTPVATNYVFVGPQLNKAMPAFSVVTDRRQPSGFWHITEIPPPTNGFTPQTVILGNRTIYCPSSGPS